VGREARTNAGTRGGGNVVNQVRITRAARVMRVVRPLDSGLLLGSMLATIFQGGKSMSLESILASLSTAEKLNAMDILWRDLSANPARLASPDWHRDVLAHRMANPSDKPRLPIDAAFADVRERLNERRTQGQ